MSFTHQVGITYKTPEGTIVSQTNSYTADGEINIDDTVAPSTTDKLYTVALTLANVKSILISSDQAVTIKTNSTGSPGDTLAIKANVPVVWDTDNLNAIPFSTAVTKLFITNAGGTLANLKVRALTTI